MMDEDVIETTVFALNSTNTSALNQTCFHKEGDRCYRTLLELQEAIAQWITPKWYEIIFMGLFGLIFIVGLVGNALVCFVVWKSQQMRTVTNIFIVNLSIADLMVLMLCLPLTLTQDVYESWPLGNTMCKVVKYIQRVSVIVSVLTLTAIAVERYYAICHPLKLTTSRKRASRIILCVWLVSFIVCIPDLIFYQTTRQFPAYVTPYFIKCGYAKPKIEYLYFFIVTFFVLPVAIMTFMYGQVARTLWRKDLPGLSGNGNSMSTGNDGLSSQLLIRRRTAKMLIVIVIFFFVCNLPVYLIVALFSHKLDSLFSYDGFVSFTMFTHAVLYLNSAMNPVIYNFMSEKFRREFRVACVCCIHLKSGLATSYSSEDESQLADRRTNLKKPGVNRPLMLEETKLTEYN